MTTHTPTIDISHDQAPLPNQSFSPWLRGQATLFISQISAILAFILFIASLVYYVSYASEKGEFLSPANVKLAVDYAHVIFIAVFILVLIQVLDDNERGSYRVNLVFRRVFKEFEEGEGNYEDRLKTSREQLRQFKRRFLWFWIGMLCLYVSFACQHSYNLATSKPQEKSAFTIEGGFISITREIPVANEKNSSPSEAKLWNLRYELSSLASAYKKSSNPGPALMGLWDVYKQLIFPFIVFFFNNLTLLFVFWCFLFMYIPSDEMAEKYPVWRNRSAILVGVLTFLFLALVPIKYVLQHDDWQAYSSIFDALSGVINAIVLALLISRLDSKLIGLPSWLISILYSYAAVQPLFLVFELSRSPVLEKIATSVLIFVFVSKIYFFLIIMYALQTGKMLNYLFCFPILHKRANNGNDVLSKTKHEQKKSSEQRVVESKRIYIVALIFASIFIASITALFIIYKSFTPGDVNRPLSSEITIWIAIFTAIVSAIGTFSSVIIAWKSYRMDAREKKLKIVQLERELAASSEKPALPIPEENRK